MQILRATIRMILFLGVTLGLYGIWCVCNLFIPNKQFWRQFIFRNWANYCIKIFGINLYVKGRQPRPPFFLVSNHLSYVDIPLMRSVLESIFVAKSEIEGWFLGGKIVRDMGNIYVNRSKKSDIPRAGNQVLEALEKGEGVIIFPEGTTSNGKKVLPFKSSFFEFACEANLPVYYAVIRYEVSAEFSPASERVAWWRDDSGFIGHLWNLFKVQNFDAFINFGENPITAENRKDLAKKLYKAVQAEFYPMD
jgi:1-acyl-sn-glycerol-3-phosphate acyltransferase